MVLAHLTFAQNFTRASESHSHHTQSNSFNFFVPSVIGIASKSFYYNAILDWSALPPQIQTIGSKLEFKRAVKKHLAGYVYYVVLFYCLL